MKTFTFTLNVQVDAVDMEQAITIAEEAKKLLEDPHNFAWKVAIDIDDVEEA